MKKLLSALIAILVVITFSSKPVSAQETEKKQEAQVIKSLIEAQHYSFVAQRVVPLSMPGKQLTSDYEMKVSKDTVEAYLPFYGKTNSIPGSIADNGINFKATDFKYTLQEKKKGGWNIKITLKDAGDTKQLSLVVSASGYATLQVTSANREFISFDGSILQ
jgi:Domain of unknown function (DUF4251)